MPDAVKLTRWIDVFWEDQASDEAEDWVFRAGTDEHGWLYVEIEPDRVLALRPSHILGILAGTVP